MDGAAPGASGAAAAGPELLGRDGELAELAAVLDRARVGRSGVLVLRGEAGIGKSALLGRVRAAGGMRVLSATGVAAEAALPYAGLHLLLRDLRPLDLTALPPAQAQALAGALGRGEAGREPADRFLVGLAALTLLAELAEERPVLCLVDDVHWLDHATAEVLVFVARRLAAEPVAMVFAARDDAGFRAADLPELSLGRLDEASSRQVLAARAGDLPRHVRDRLVCEAGGNPLALVELAAAHRAGRLVDYPVGPPDGGLGGAPSTGSRVEREFAARVAVLRPSVRTLLLVAAADGSCDTGLVLAAAGRLGSSITDMEHAESAGMLMFTSGCLGFVHPLIRAAVYGGETIGRKQAAHRALADAVDQAVDPDRWAWHRSAAAIGTDAEAANALDRSALRARERGSPAAAATAHERAAALTADPAQRGGRLAAAAAAAADGGLRDWAADLARRAAEHLTDPVSAARLALIEAAIAEADDRPEQAVQLLHQPAVAVAALDPALAADMLTWVVEAGWSARDPAAVRWAVAAVDRLGLTGSGHLLALAEVVTEQLDDSLPASPVRPPVAPVCGWPESPRGQTKMARWSLALGDHRRAHQLATAAERTARARGELGVLPDTLAVLATTRWHLGQPRDAAAAADEGLRIAHDVGSTRSVDTLAAAMAQLAAATGDEPACERALAQIGGRSFAAAAGTARSLLDLGAGRFDAAADRLADLIAGAPAPEVRTWLPDLVEAAARAGRPEQAAAAAARFTRWADRVDLPWAHALALRCRALTTEGPAAGTLFARAVATHRSEVVPEPDPAPGARPGQPRPGQPRPGQPRPGESRPGESRPFERARTELLYGEWLRRARRRTAARAPLRSACETFDDLGATPWANRARAELRATGESRADPPSDGRLALTPQELQVVRLAAAGLSNREIGAQLFLSPRTVGYHLHKAFPKLGVASRAQLAGLDLPA